MESAELISKLITQAFGLQKQVNELEKKLAAKQSEQVDLLYAAQAKSMLEITTPTKSKKANYGTYSTLEDYVGCLRPALAKNGLSFSQEWITDNTIDYIETKLMHISGQWRCARFQLVVPDSENRNQMQALGSASTYILRYTLRSFFGLGGGEDDDDADTFSHNKQTSSFQKTTYTK